MEVLHTVMQARSITGASKVLSVPQPGSSGLTAASSLRPKRDSAVVVVPVGEADIAHARIIDNFEVDDADGERENFKVESGCSGDTIYPYLVTSREQALVRLTRRHEPVLRGIGEKYAPIYDGVVALIARDFGPFILVRTAGLPGPENAEPWLRETAGSMDSLDDGPGPTFEAMVADFKTWQNADPIWLLSGARPDAWPTPALASAVHLRRHFTQSCISP